MASIIRETTNHYYTQADILGKGATCEVYKGISKGGEYRALKIFLTRGRSSEIQREVTALRNLQHENVVIFYNLEKDLLTSRPVVVTELCENGSLQDVLNELQNKYGLNEEEFLLIFRHLVNGIRHLRLNGFIHRDIKPGNILRCIDDTGRSLYKLSDFGTARVLEDDGQFMSLCGTEEYLHPKLYQAAFFKGNLEFDAKVDLWSLGATLYHCATGTVPFRPYGGREDKEAMYRMLVERPSGVIGGLQQKPNGKIYWIKDLPPSTSLSSGLKRLITPLIAGLLEIQEDKTWTFERFFLEAEVILNKISVTVLSTFQNPTWLNQLYMNPQDSLLDLQQHLTDHTGIEQGDQLLFYQNEVFQKSASSNKESLSEDFPKTSLQTPMILLHRQNVRVNHGPCTYLEEVEGDNQLQFTSTMDLNIDIQIANMIGGHINILYQQCIIASSLQQHTIELQHKLRKNLQRNIELAKNERHHLTELYDEARHIVCKAATLYTDSDIWPLSVDITMVEAESLLISVRENLEFVVEKFPNNVINPDDDWCFYSMCPNKCLCILTQASEIINRMSNRRKMLFGRQKSTYDGLQHSADKNKLLKLKQSMVSLWRDHCLIKTRLLQDKINSWSWSHIEASDKVDDCLKRLETLRVSILKVFKLLRKESPESLDDDPGTSSAVVNTYSRRVSEIEKLTNSFPEVYQPEDMSLDVRGTVIQSEDQSMGTLIL